ncbi:MAG: YaeQ family protein [gamma proteobacterium symbiont of Bathyaustriella thionipta]|nr:YaeQ family protein [gamma proteobacterium symbiont of Bathyaustriella thionipta]
MALNSTIHKATVHIANMDRHYYQNHELTLAQHPSETDLRFMVRLLAFIFNAHEQLQFSKGLSSDGEPDLWQKSLSGEIELWIDLGQPDEKRIRKACGRAQQVIIYTYQPAKANIWWQQHHTKLTRFHNLRIIQMHCKGVEAMIKRSMQLQCNIQDGELYLNDDDLNLTITLEER